VNIITRKDFYEEARKWVGAPWKHQGRTMRGLDCGGLLIMTAKNLGLPHEDLENYPRDPTATSVLDHLSKMLTKSFKNEIIPGQVGIFREGAYPCHVGIFSEKDSHLHIIHSLIKRRKTIEEPYISQVGGLQLVGVYDFNNVIP